MAMVCSGHTYHPPSCPSFSNKSPGHWCIIFICMLVLWTLNLSRGAHKWAWIWIIHWTMGDSSESVFLKRKTSPSPGAIKSAALKGRSGVRFSLYESASCLYWVYWAFIIKGTEFCWMPFPASEVTMKCSSFVILMRAITLLICMCCTNLVL